MAVCMLEVCSLVVCLFCFAVQRYDKIAYFPNIYKFFLLLKNYFTHKLIDNCVKVITLQLLLMKTFRFDMNTTFNFVSLSYRQSKTYLFSVFFILGNILLPQLCHLVHLGGPTLLPIYFFTLVGAYKYGIRLGLLVAILSPLVNSFFFGMPVPALLPAIICKSVLMAVAAGYMAGRTGKLSILSLIGIVLFYQIVGGIFEWAISGSLDAALQDFRIGVPGMLLQIFGGYLLLRSISRI